RLGRRRARRVRSHPRNLSGECQPRERVSDPRSATTRFGTPAVAIVGGGVIGLAVGWRLAAAGIAVDLFERDEVGRGASWAAAGMLAAGVETEPGERPLHGLHRQSQETWPEFARALEAASGGSVD